MTALFHRLKKSIPHHHPLRLLYHKARAVVAALFYRFPSESMIVIAVTGTNGKTTTCHLITEILMAAGYKVGMLTTADFRIGETTFMNEYKLTTLSPFVLQRFLREMVNRDCQYAVVEVTSHAMDQNRLWGVNVDVAVFTNISHDHLDYHASLDDYLHAKGKLFTLLNHGRRKTNVSKVSIVNGDDPYAEYFQQFVADRSYVFGIKKGSFNASDIELYSNRTKFLFKVPNHQIPVQLPMPGQFNVENALAAGTVGIALQINPQIIAHALENAAPVPGRLERIEEGQKYTIIVDYAHTPDALEKLLSMFRALTPKRLIVVFGATGDRDRTKRPGMGQIVDRYADVVVLTDDDPYTEDPLSILEAVAQGIPRQEGDRFWKIPERRQAIRLALAIAREGDTVIITGKGCESFQVVGTEKIPSDDRQIVRAFLAREIDIQIAPGHVESGNRYLES